MSQTFTQQATAESFKQRRAALASLSPPQRPCFSPFSEGRSGRGDRSGTPGTQPDVASAASDEAAAAAGWLARARTTWHGARAAWASLRASLEAGLRSALRSNLHALVSGVLILALFVGTTGLAAFLSVRVAQEGRATVLAVRDVFPAAWAGMAASTPLLADAAAAADSSAGRVDAGAGGAAAAAAGGGGAGGPPPPALPRWVAAYQREALGLVQQALPALASWGEGQFYGFLERQNLTSALG